MKVDRKINIPLYMQVYESLLKAIRENRYRSGELLPSERELAALFGVDRLTVRRALEILVTEGVVEKKAGLGSRLKNFSSPHWPNVSTRGIAFILPRTVNLIDRITEPFNSCLFYRIEKEVKEKGYSLIYTTLSDEEPFPPLLREDAVAGILFVSQIPKRFIQEARNLNIPAVVVNNDDDCFPAVIADREQGAFEGVKHLISLGHRRIAFISGIPSYSTSQACLAGYQKALAEAGLEQKGQILKEGNWTFDGGYQCMKEIIEEADDLPTSIFACNDMTALGAMEAIRESGLSVPGDISILGVDDIEQCTHYKPKLTTVRVDSEPIARAACQSLFCAIETGQTQNLKIIVPTRLVVRESVSPPREN